MPRRTAIPISAPTGLRSKSRWATSMLRRTRSPLTAECVMRRPAYKHSPGRSTRRANSSSASCLRQRPSRHSLCVAFSRATARAGRGVRHGCLFGLGLVLETRRRSNAPWWSAPNFQCIARPGHTTVDGLVHEWERWGARLWRLSIHATPFALPLYARADAPDTACNRTSLKRGDERRRDWCRRRGHKPRSCCRASPPALRRGGDDVGCAHTGRYTTRPCWPTALPTA